MGSEPPCEGQKGIASLAGLAGLRGLQCCFLQGLRGLGGGRVSSRASKDCPVPQCPGSAGQNQGWDELHVEDPKCKSWNTHQGSWIPALHLIGGERAAQRCQGQAKVWHAGSFLICRPRSETLSQPEPQGQSRGNSVPQALCDPDPHFLVSCLLFLISM